MCLEFIEQKIGGKRPGSTKVADLQYASPAQLRADFQLLHDNCMKYNEPGLSPYNFPPAREAAGRVLAAADAALAKIQNSRPLLAALEFANVSRRVV